MTKQKLAVQTSSLQLIGPWNQFLESTGNFMAAQVEKSDETIKSIQIVRLQY